MLKNWSYLWHLGLLLVAALPALAQDDSTTAKGIDEVVRRIQKIRKPFVQLEAEEFLEEPPDGGALLSVYFSNNVPVRIQREIGLSHGNEVMNFYFAKGKLIKVEEEFHSFIPDRNGKTLRKDTTEQTFHGVYYFQSDRLLFIRTTGHNRFEDDRLDPEQVLMRQAAALYLLAKRAGS